jgi:hypothetical protein
MNANDMIRNMLIVSRVSPQKSSSTCSYPRSRIRGLTRLLLTFSEQLLVTSIPTRFDLHPEPGLIIHQFISALPNFTCYYSRSFTTLRKARSTYHTMASNYNTPPRPSGDQNRLSTNSVTIPGTTLPYKTKPPPHRQQQTLPATQCPNSQL